MIRMDATKDKDIVNYNRIYAGLDKITNKTARKVIAGLVAAPEMDIGV